MNVPEILYIFLDNSEKEFERFVLLIQTSFRNFRKGFNFFENKVSLKYVLNQTQYVFKIFEKVFEFFKKKG